MHEGQPTPPATTKLLDRLLFLSDGVFAIAITLLVLEIALPPIAGSLETEVRKFPELIRSVWPQILTYALTFVIVGVY